MRERDKGSTGFAKGATDIYGDQYSQSRRGVAVRGRESRVATENKGAGAGEF